MHSRNGGQTQCSFLDLVNYLRLRNEPSFEHNSSHTSLANAPATVIPTVSATARITARTRETGTLCSDTRSVTSSLDASEMTPFSFSLKRWDAALTFATALACVVGALRIRMERAFARLTKDEFRVKRAENSTRSLFSASCAAGPGALHLLPVHVLHDAVCSDTVPELLLSFPSPDQAGSLPSQAFPPRYRSCDTTALDRCFPCPQGHHAQRKFWLLRPPPVGFGGLRSVSSSSQR